MATQELSAEAEAVKTRFVAALNRELEVARTRVSGTRSNEVIGGSQVSASKQKCRYEFDELNGFPLEEGVDITLSITPEKSSPGKYLGEINSRHLFELKENLGKEIEKAQVTSDPLFLLEKQIAMLSADSTYKNQLALASVGAGTPKSPPSIQIKDIFAQDLNSLQSHVLEVARNEAITYVWGPPGTGKTTTVGSLVAALAETGQRVLMVSNTNLAIDTALERCLNRYTRIEKLAPAVMLRIGSMVKPELIAKYGEQVDLDLVYEREAAPILKQISQTSAQVSQIQDKIEKDSALLREIDTKNNKVERAEKLAREVEELKEQIDKARRDIEKNETNINALRRELKESSSVGAVRRAFSGKRRPADIQSAIRSKETDVDKGRKDSDKKTDAKKSKSAEAKVAKEEAETAKKWLASIVAVDEVRQRVQTARGELSGLEAEIKKLNSDLEELRAQLLAKARVIACTAYKPLLDSGIQALDFDVVVVDEVSMLTLPLFFCTATRAKTRLVVAGDFRQLPPIVRLEDREDSRWAKSGDSDHFLTLTASPFEASGVTEPSKSLADKRALIALRDQYRMRIEISDLVSRYFYPEHPLKAANDVRDKPTPWGNETFIVVDSSNLEPESSDQSGSRRNISHGLLVAAICEQLLKDGWSFDALAEKSLGVVTPYRKQAKLIQEVLSLPSSSGVHGGVSTVHRFQGNERDTIIIDFTRVTSELAPSLGKFVGDPAPFSPGNAKWNVAISRARQHVIVVVDLPTLWRSPTALFSVLVEEILPKAKVLDGKDLIEKHLSKRLPTSPSKSKGAIAWFTGEGFYKAFEKDLLQAKQSLLIASPFVSKRATSRWLPILENLRDRNIKTICLTKPLSEWGDSDSGSWAHDKLDLVFDTLRVVPKMHEKIAVIDDTVVWLGSLNILSHVSSSEIMVRVSAPEFAQSIVTEYARNQRANKGGSKFGKNRKIMKVGDSCDTPGCSGKMIRKPAGVSRASGKPYEAFLSCDQYPRCENSANFG